MTGTVRTEGQRKIKQNRGVIFLIGVVLAIFVVPDAWKIPTVIGFAILEVVETTVTWRLSRRGASKVGPETLIGSVGSAITECRPSGTVRVLGDVWQARCDAGAAAGQRVRVVGRDRLTLQVEPIESVA
jgi:membrane-bound serine protease (ClpP class)